MLENYFEEVDLGWKNILIALDKCFVYVLGEQFEDKLRVLQVKEKFGGLRVYIDSREVPQDISRRLHDLINMAEVLSFRTCEECGKPASETRGPKNQKMGWMKTYCTECHEERDKTGKPFWMKRATVGRKSR